MPKHTGSSLLHAIGSSDIEKKFLGYQKSQQGNGDFSEAVLGDSNYERRFKMPGWNILVSMLMEPKVAVRHFDTLGVSTSKAAHSQRADHFRSLRTKFEASYQDLITAALKEYGNGDGVAISGIYRSHFPESVKDRLRFLAHGKSMLTDAVRLHEHLSKSRSPLFK